MKYDERSLGKYRRMRLKYLKNNLISDDCGFMDRVRHFNTARSLTEEVVLREIVYR